MTRKFYCTLALSCLLLTTASAQSAKWEIGAQVGGANYMGDLVSTLYPTLNATRPSGSLFLRRNLSETWSLRLNGTLAQLSGDDKNFESKFGNRGYSFTTNLAEGALLAEYDPFGHRRYDKGHLKKTFSPYFFGGIAGVAFDPTPDFNDGSPNALALQSQIAADKRRDFSKQVFSLPFGAGVRYDISRRVTIGLEGGMRMPFTDYLDGISEAANADKRDWYVTGGLNLSYKFGLYKDTDGDKVLDRYDACPAVPGEVLLAGCPDADGDGITDEKDKCPYQRGPASLEGCPDRDGDGIADKEDDCPDQYGLKVFKGCADKDNDGIPDNQDTCPDLSGVPSAKGCPDADLDSIPNNLDKCPTEAGPAVNKGCPDRDTDSDGLVDRLDECPDKAGLRVLNGCPDTDGDGITDSRDNCPTAAGTFANKGCPELKKEEKEVLDKAIRGVQFDPAKATLRKVSFPILDNVAVVLKKYPNYKVSIQGHTDGDGDEKKNLTLSENRAKACREYLITKGVDAARMTAKGFGESKPLVPNTTKENKAQNRRVEFILE